jgi:hypothetical protein
MGNRVLLAFVLAPALFAPRVAAAPVMNTVNTPVPGAEPAATTFDKVDAALAEANRAMQTLQECTKVTAAMRADHAAKQAGLKAEYGAVPPAFNEHLLKKRKRIDKQELLCLQYTPQPGELLSKAHQLLRYVEPKNTPGIAGRFKRVEEARLRYNKLIAAPKGNPK